MAHTSAPDCTTLARMSFPELLYHALASNPSAPSPVQPPTSWRLSFARELDLFLHFGIGPFAAPTQL